MVMKLAPAAACLLLLAGPLLANAYPTLWVNQVLPLEVLKGAPLTPQNCIRHPTTKEGGHKAPSVDKAITITVTEAAAKAPVKELCPGTEYTVTVGYPEKRRTLLTTTVGQWDKGNGSCPALVLTPKPDKAAESFKATLSVPCNATETSTTLQVTSAAGPSAAFKTATVNLPITALTKCPKSNCAAATAGNKTLDSNKTMTANETMAGDETMAANETIAGNETMAGNETIDGVLPAANATDAADNTTAPAAGDADKAAGGAAKAAESPKGTPKAEGPKAPEAPAKPKSAAAGSNPTSLLAAAAGVIVLGAILL